MKNSWKFAATAFSAAALLGGLHGAAQADTTYNFSTEASDQTLLVSQYSTNGVYVGRYSLTAVPGSTSINVFCVDFSHEIVDPSQFVANTDFGLTAGPSATPPAPYYNGGLVSALTPADYKPNAGGPVSSMQQRANDAAYLADTYLDDNSLTNQQYAAVQLAIWDIVQDGGDGLATGSGQVYLDYSASDPIYTTYAGLVAGYESQVETANPGKSGTAVWIQTQRNDPNNIGTHVQEFVGEDGDVHPQGGPVPEPGPVAMLASLGLAVGGLLLKRLRVRPTA